MHWYLKLAVRYFFMKKFKPRSFWNLRTSDLYLNVTLKLNPFEFSLCSGFSMRNFVIHNDLLTTFLQSINFLYFSFLLLSPQFFEPLLGDGPVKNQYVFSSSWLCTYFGAKSWYERNLVGGRDRPLSIWYLPAPS